MPRRRTSIKKTRADKKKRVQNLRIKQTLKKAIKKFHEQLSAKNTDEAKTLLKKIYSQLDKAAKKRILHPQTSNRRKSRLALKLTKPA